MRGLFLVSLLLSMVLASEAQLRVSENGRYLVGSDGKPFFWMGDTAWELFHRLNREETTLYLRNRADKGFTVIQAVALAELDGLHTPNAYGHTPFKDDDPLQPVEAYWQHIDWVISEAARHQLYIGLLPTWGDKIFRDAWGIGPVIFNESNAGAYGEWIAKRYKDRKNIIWILGGDRNPRNEQDMAIWRAMARGIEQGAGGPDKALITFHPQPNDMADGGSSKWFHQDAWLDFNMFQTGHCRENPVWNRISVAYDRKPVKPVIDGETIYEDHPVCFNAPDLGTSSAYDVRKNAWFSILSGSFGHTYGCHPVWQMYDSGRQAINGPHYTWKEALDLPGAGQMKLLRYVEMMPASERKPAQDLLAYAGGVNNHIICARGGGVVMAYTSQGLSVQFIQDMLGKKNQHRKAWWLNVRTGEHVNGNAVFEGRFILYRPPTSGYGQDWLLVLEEGSSVHADDKENGIK